MKNLKNTNQNQISFFDKKNLSNISITPMFSDLPDSFKEPTFINIYIFLYNHGFFKFSFNLKMRLKTGAIDYNCYSKKLLNFENNLDRIFKSNINRLCSFSYPPNHYLKKESLEFVKVSYQMLKDQILKNIDECSELFFS